MASLLIRIDYFNYVIQGILKMFSNNDIKILLAYVDPGTGSYLIQMLIAAILGGMFALKMYWKKLTHLITSKFSKSKES